MRVQAFLAMTSHGLALAAPNGNNSGDGGADPEQASPGGAARLPLAHLPCQQWRLGL